MSMIHDTAIIRDSSYNDVKIFRNALVLSSQLADGCSVGDDTVIERCQFQRNVIINRRSYVNDSLIGAYTYAGINLTMNWTKIGNFCSIGRNVDIGGFDHDYQKLTTIPSFRFNQMSHGGGAIKDTFKSADYCTIGNDVWIAAGAQVLHKVRIGDGAVIGGGAVVTKDVPPYAIVVGVPAKIIAYRCEESLIKDLLKIQWWNWPISIILENMDYLMNHNISEETIKYLYKISEHI